MEDRAWEALDAAGISVATLADTQGAITISGERDALGCLDRLGRGLGCGHRGLIEALAGQGVDVAVGLGIGLGLVGLGLVDRGSVRGDGLLDDRLFGGKALAGEGVDIAVVSSRLLDDGIGRRLDDGLSGSLDDGGLGGHGLGTDLGGRFLGDDTALAGEAVGLDDDIDVGISEQGDSSLVAEGEREAGVIFGLD